MNMTPRAVLLKTGLTPLNTVRHVNTAHLKSAVHSAKSMSYFSKQAQSTAQRPFYKQTTLTSRYVNTAMRHYHTERPRAGNTARSYTEPVNAVRAKRGKPLMDDKGFVDSGCSRHMTGNIAYLSDFKEFDGGYVTFGGGAHGGRISGKGTLKTDSLDFEDVYFVNELKFNLFSVSQMCDKKNYVLFTDTECLVLSLNFKLPDENQILLKILRKDNMYSFDMKNIVPKKSLTCLVANATLDESMLWHRRLGHINFKNINKLVKDNLVRGLPIKCFENDQTCVACLTGKQHKASCKSKVLNPITKPLFMLHMNLFGPTFVSSLMHKKYCLVVTNDYSREKGIKREYSVARTPQQNGVAERRNKTLIKAAKTMLADSKLPTTFWAEAVSTACYVQNRVLVVKPHNKTPYELFRGFKPALSFMKPFGCHVTILNTLDSLGKFDGKSDEENKSLIEGNGPKLLFDIDSLTQSINYVPVAAGTIINESDVDNDEPKSAADDQKQVEDGLDNENDAKDKSDDDSSPKEVNAAGQHIVSTLDTTHVEFFSDEDELEVDLRNITNSYTVPTTPNTRIHKDHPIKNVIGDVKSSIQTRRMTKSILIKIKPISIAKALSDSSWVEAMDVKSSFLYEILCEDVLCNRPPGFKDPDNPDKVYKVVKALYGLHQVPKAWSMLMTLSLALQTRSYKEDGIFISHDKYVDEIMKKFNYTDVKSAYTLVDLEKPLVKDRDANDVDVHLYRSMIGSLMYLTSSRPDIIYLKGKPTLGLWYSRDSPFELVAYTDSDYVGATQDRKSTTGGCQFLGNRLISWQCKKQTVVATSTTEAEYVAVASYHLTKGFDAGRFQYLVSNIRMLNP
ncbi:ribonuclease H-like domain-containing protein [Tanacetum coccineum]